RPSCPFFHYPFFSLQGDLVTAIRRDVPGAQLLVRRSTPISGDYALRWIASVCRRCGSYQACPYDVVYLDAPVGGLGPTPDLCRGLTQSRTHVLTDGLVSIASRFGAAPPPTQHLNIRTDLPDRVRVRDEPDATHWRTLLVAGLRAPLRPAFVTS